MYRIMLAVLATLFMGSVSTEAFAQDAEDGTEEVAEPDPATQVHVRLLTHFHKKMSDSGWGVGGWIIMPDIVKMGTTPLFLVGPRYQKEWRMGRSHGRWFGRSRPGPSQRRLHQNKDSSIHSIPTVSEVLRQALQRVR